MDNVKYCRPSDIITPLIVDANVATLGGVYGLQALYDELPSRPAIFTTPGSVRIVYDLGVQTRVDGFSMPNSNLDVGLNCLVQMNALDAWGAPSVSGSMITGADHINGHRASPWIDLTTISGYTTAGFRYVSLVVPTNSQDIKIGETLILGRLREFSRWPQWGGTKGSQRRWLENIETEYGVQRVFRRRITQRTFSYPIQGNGSTDFDDLQTLADDASGVARAFFITRDSDVKTDGGLYAKFTPDTIRQLDVTEEWYDAEPFTLTVMELSRSLPL